MTQQPVPTAIHPDQPITSPVLRDAPPTDFFTALERSGATPDLLNELRNDW